MPWSEYLNTMAQNSSYGDQLTLQAMANLYLVEIIVVSSLGPEGRTVISPQNCEPVARVFLGHFSEDEGIHYVCLVATRVKSKYKLKIYQIFFLKRLDQLIQY